MIETLPFFLILILMILEVTMNPFKNIATFRDQICNCLPWGKDTKKKENMDYKYLLQENERLQHLVQCLVLQLGKTGDQKFPLKEIDKQMALFDDGGLDGTPRNIEFYGDVSDDPSEIGTIFPRKTL